MARMRSVGRWILVLTFTSVVGGCVNYGTQKSESRSAPVFPLKKSSNNRHFVDQKNTPFFINGDTPWSLIGQISKEDADLYIRDAACKGINSLIVTLVESHYADNAPANYYGDVPYTTPGVFTTPNEAYFAHADWVIRKAAEYHIQIILAPNYLGCCTDGYWDQLSQLNSEADARWFGEWIGNRYQDFPNLMYVWVNDTNPCGVDNSALDCEMKKKIAGMAAGVQSTDPNHLHTTHPSPEFSAIEHFSPTIPYNGFTLDVNTTYTYRDVQNKVLEDYNRIPPLPFFLFESHYEHDWGGATARQTRRQAYVAILSGAAGHHYGNNPIWHMNGKPSDDTTDWKEHLSDEGRVDLVHIRHLFESRNWTALLPDQLHEVITAGYGSGQAYVAGARTTDGATVIAYLPSEKTITINMASISGAYTKAWWFNPRDGNSHTIGVFRSAGNHNFTTPDELDWVLILDNAASELPTPGSTLFYK